jgi:hypothetical protein
LRLREKRSQGTKTKTNYTLEGHAPSDLPPPSKCHLLKVPPPHGKTPLNLIYDVLNCKTGPGVCVGGVMSGRGQGKWRG